MALRKEIIPSGNDSANEERSMKDTVVRGITLRAPCVPWNRAYLTERKTPCPLDMGIEASPFKVAWEVGFPS